MFWYSIGELVAVVPFTRSRMNRKTLGCYGRSARTSPVVSRWLWGVCFRNTDGMPSAWDAGLKCFGEPNPVSRVHDLKAEAIAQAKELAASVAAAQAAEMARFNARSELAKRICLRVYGDETHEAEALPLWQIIDEEVAREP